MNILDKIEQYLTEKKFELKNLKVEKNARTNEIMLSYDGNTFYVPTGDFTSIKFESKDGKMYTTTSVAFAGKKFDKYFTKEGMEHLRTEFQKIKSKGLTGENVYKHFHMK